MSQLELFGSPLTTKPAPPTKGAAGRQLELFGSAGAKGAGAAAGKTAKNQVKKSLLKRIGGAAIPGLNALMYAWMAYDILKATGAFGGDVEDRATNMAAIQGGLMPGVAQQQAMQNAMFQQQQQAGLLERSAMQARGLGDTQKALGRIGDEQLDAYLATKKGTLAAAGFMNPTMQNQVASLANMGVL